MKLRTALTIAGAQARSRASRLSVVGMPFTYERISLLVRLGPLQRRLRRGGRPPGTLEVERRGVVGALPRSAISLLEKVGDAASGARRSPSVVWRLVVEDDLESPLCR